MFTYIRNVMARVLTSLMQKSAFEATAEDLRKVAVTAMGVGIVGLVVSGDTVKLGEALLVFWIGALLWISGIIATGISKPDKES